MDIIVKRIVFVALVLFTILQIVYGLSILSGYFPEQAGGDLLYRRNEICCAHKGVNSFRIWNRETTLQGFVPLERPDKPDVSHTENEAVVHAYPPWHTAMFYWYGWISERLCLIVMSVVFGLCIYFIVSECINLSRLRFGNNGLIPGFALAMISFFAFHCFSALNYGVLILAAFLLMNKAIEKRCYVVAGLAWSVMMIKPQVGLLFFWPLLWHRCYRTIATAIGVCLVATFATSLIVHESMLDLLLQVPQIGKPYNRAPYADLTATRYLLDLLFKPVVGESLPVLVMISFFVLTGFLTRFFRQGRDFFLDCVIVVLMIPFWSYSHTHDHVILLPAFILLAGKMFTAQKFNKWIALGLCYCTMIIVKCIWWILVYGMHLFEPTGKGWMYRGASLGSELCWCLFLVFLVREKKRKTLTSICQEMK